MSEFFKSAFDYFGSGQKSRGGTNELVGNSIEIGDQYYKVLNVIAEGGFAVVFEAQDTKTNRHVALKRLISHDAETSKEIMREINFIKKLCDHPNIIRLLTAASIGQERQRSVGTEFLIVTEFCSGGQLVQLMHRRNKVFSYNVIIQIFTHVCKAVEHMHNQNPPIIHRDLKVENLLINSRAVIKLCDFGSATTELHFPDNTWSGSRRNEVKEEIEKHTTPMYRTPEMLDLYQNYPINQACDIWALGCVLYYLCCNKHPFEDSSKLAILNANYAFPTNVEVNDGLCGLIYQMLLIDPRQRPGISEILSEIRVQASSANVQLKPSIIFDKESLNLLPNLLPFPDKEELPQVTDAPKPAAARQTAQSQAVPKPAPARPTEQFKAALPKHPQQPPSKPIPKPRVSQVTTSVASADIRSAGLTKSPINSPSNGPQSAANADGKKVLGFLKEGAGSIMKNIRDASNKVIEQVSATINKTDLDINYVTSRIITMPTPGETGIDTITRDKIDDIQTYLDFRHPNQYFIYNLSLRLLKTERTLVDVSTTIRLKDRVLQMGFIPSKPPPLSKLIELLLHQISWLSSNPKNVVVIQCADGKTTSSMIVAALFCFCRLTDTSSAAYEIVKFRRADVQLTPSQCRYIDYVCRLVRFAVEPSIQADVPHNFGVRLTGLEMEPVPIFNRSRTGIRPFVEIFNDYKLVYSSIKSYEELVVFTPEQKTAKIVIPNLVVQGDLNIVIYHTRSNIVAKGKMSLFKVCETQIHTGYLPSSNEIVLSKNQLDNLDSDDEKYPPGFSLKIQIHLTNKEILSQNQIQLLSWNSNDFKSKFQDSSSRDDRLLPFFSYEEMRTCIVSANVKLPMKEQKQKPDSTTDVKSSVQKDDFFGSLDWMADNNSEPEMFTGDTSAVKAPDTISQEDNFNNIPLFNIDNSSNYDRKEEQSNENQFWEEAVGDLLGDLDNNRASQPVKCSEPVVKEAENNDIVGLMDFLSSNNPEPQVHSNVPNFDIFADLSHTTDKNNVNLLMFEADDKSDKIFDPFNQNSLFSSCSTSNLTTLDQKPNNEWANAVFGSTSVTHNNSQPVIKPSNSTNSLLNITNNPGNMKPSPSFNSHFNGGQKISGSDFDIFDKPVQKPSVAPKPKFTINKDQDVFGKANSSGSSNKQQKYAFEDLLGDFKPSETTSNGSKSIKDMRKEQMTKTTDPETLKILDWVEGRERNIRALLCALPMVLWTGIRWPGVNMAELVTVDHVKKAYRNAIRCVHPDKWNNTEYENLAKMIMIELNDAMTEFESEKNAASVSR